MTAVNLQALLPGSDGCGWHAVTDDGMSGPPPLCSAKGCLEPAVAYHRAVHAGEKRIYRNKYQCPAHLVAPLVVMHGRVWMNTAAVAV